MNKDKLLVNVWKCSDCNTEYEFYKHDYKQDAFVCKRCKGVVFLQEIDRVKDTTLEDKLNKVLKKLENVEYKIDLLTDEYDKLNRDIYLNDKAVGSAWNDIEYRSDY